MAKELKALTGKFVHHDVGDGYRTGQIVYLIQSFVLVQFDAMGGSDAIKPMELVRLEDLCEPGRWHLFNTRADMDSWIARQTEADRRDAQMRVN
jgi:hypothetical protein